MLTGQKKITHFRILCEAYSMVDSKIRFSAKRNRTQERWC